MPSLVMLVFAGVLVAGGVYLTLERTLSRVVIGLSLLTNGINVLILAMGGAAGSPPLIGTEAQTIVDPLPQAFILTAIVLSLGTTAFGLALAYRSWRQSGHDEVADDVEDRQIARRLERSRRNEDHAVSGAEDPNIVYDEVAAEGTEEDSQ